MYPPNVPFLMRSFAVDVVVTGARDGSILFWDERILSNDKDPSCIPRISPCAVSLVLMAVGDG